jgi:DNA polymerase-1
MQENNKLFLVDGSSLAFRSFFAMITSGMRNADGIPAWAVYGFFASLFDLIEKRAPHSMAICFDLGEPTFRHEQFEDYKAHRDEMPDDLSIQWPIIKKAVEALSIPVYELAGWEADDIIGTVAKKAMSRNLSTVILTGDQDAFQLLDDHIEVLMPTKEGLKTYGRQEVFEKLGVWPEQIIDYKALCGDTSDNIPGVKGIGPKTAVTLLSQYQTLDGIYEHLGEIKSASQKTKLEEGKASAYASQTLATIRLDVPLEFDFDHCELKCDDPAKICEIFRNMEFRNLLKRLPKILSYFNNGVEPEIDPALLQVPAKSRMKSGASFSRSENLSAASPTSSSDGPLLGGRQLSLLEAASATGNVAVLAPQELKVETLRNKADIAAFCDELCKAPNVSLSFRASSEHAFDAELHGVSFCYSDSLAVEDGRLIFKELKAPARVAYIPMERPGEGPVSRNDVLQIFKPLLEDASVSKIIYDAKFAANALSLHGIELKGVVFDPMLASYILNPDENHKLSAQSSAILARRLPELPPVNKKSGGLEYLPLNQLAHVTSEEAHAVHDLAIAYVKVMDDDQRELMWAMDLPLSNVLARMEQNGVKLDLPYFKALGKELQEDISRLEKEIFELAGHEFNIGSPIQLQKVLFEELGLPAKVKTKTGYSTDAAVLESLEAAHPIVQKILEYRHLTKLSSTYVEALPKLISPRDQRLHGEFNQATTATGRLSSTNPNLQNIPIKTDVGIRIRGGFVAADESSVIMSADYSQIELRLLAHMSGDEKLIEAFKADEDIHARTAALIFDVPVDQVTAEHRRVGKTLNFALIYQQGAFATGQSLGISTKEATSFIDKYFTSFSKVRAFMTRVISEARECGYVQTLWGRRRYFTHLNDRNDGIRKADERAAFNAPLQGSAADLMKLAMIRLQNGLNEKGMKTKLILQVHDELVLDVPADEVEQARELLLASMTMGQPLLVPLKVDVGSGKHWMEAK